MRSTQAAQGDIIIASAQSPWADDGRIYASRRLDMSDANKKNDCLIDFMKVEDPFRWQMQQKL